MSFIVDAFRQQVSIHIANLSKFEEQMGKKLSGIKSEPNPQLRQQRKLLALQLINKMRSQWTEADQKEVPLLKVIKADQALDARPIEIAQPDRESIGIGSQQAFIERESFECQTSQPALIEESLSPFVFSQEQNQNDQKVEEQNQILQPKSILKVASAYHREESQEQPISDKKQKTRTYSEFESQYLGQNSVPEENPVLGQSDEKDSQFNQKSKRVKFNEEGQINVVHDAESGPAPPNFYDMNLIREKINSKRFSQSKTKIYSTQNELITQTEQDEIQRKSNKTPQKDFKTSMRDSLVDQASRFSFSNSKPDDPRPIIGEPQATPNSDKENIVPSNNEQKKANVSGYQPTQNEIDNAIVNQINQSFESLHIEDVQKKQSQQVQEQPDEGQPLGDVLDRLLSIPLNISQEKQEAKGNQEQQNVADFQQEQSSMHEHVYKEESLTPQLYEEFLQCHSHYHLSDKESSDEISSDGEFNNARDIDVFQEDDSMINLIEDQKRTNQFFSQNTNFRTKNTPSFKQNLFPQSLKKAKTTTLIQKEETKDGKAKTKRFQGLTHFNKVGYTASTRKAIPRWCTDMDLLNRVVMYQKKCMNGDELFGKMDPRVGIPTLREMFHGNVQIMQGTRKQRKYDYRGSSAIWNDDQEFATPYAGKSVSITHQTAHSQPTNDVAISHFNPYAFGNPGRSIHNTSNHLNGNVSASKFLTLGRTNLSFGISEASNSDMELDQ